MSLWEVKQVADYTIQELLSSETLQGLTLVAGKNGLDRRIGNVNTIENLDSYDWLRAGDFLLTTGFIYKDDPDQLLSMVERLAQINCAGLGFKMMRYFEALPEEMIRRAEELDFPILLIPLKYSLADVSNEINDHLRGVEDFWFFKYLNILNHYNDAVLNGKGVNGIIDALYHFIHTPVVLVDSRWRLLAMCDPEGALSELKLNTRGFPQEFMDSVPKIAVGKANLLTRSFPGPKEELIVRVTQLEDASSIYGYVMAFETGQKMDWMDFVAFESATTPLVLERVKAKQLNEVRHQIRQDFFDDLLQGRIDSVNAASSLAEIHHMDIHKTYLSMVIKLTEPSGDGQCCEDQRNRFLKMKNEIIAISDSKALAHNFTPVSIHRSNLIISFIPIPKSLEHAHTWEILDGFPEEASEAIGQEFDVDFQIGVGTPISDYLNLRSSYFQANEAIRHAHDGERGSVCYYENFMVDQLIDNISDRKILETFVNMSLGVLRDHDREHGTNLVKTLEIYFECNGNVSIAAKRLFLHRNSLIYRMDRIKDILNTDLKNPSELLTLQVGLRVLRVLESRHPREASALSGEDK